MRRPTSTPTPKWAACCFVISTKATRSQTGKVKQGEDFLLTKGIASHDALEGDSVGHLNRPRKRGAFSLLEQTETAAVGAYLSVEQVDLHPTSRGSLHPSRTFPYEKKYGHSIFYEKLFAACALESVLSCPSISPTRTEKIPPNHPTTRFLATKCPISFHTHQQASMLKVSAMSKL